HYTSIFWSRGVSMLRFIQADNNRYQILLDGIFATLKKAGIIKTTLAESILVDATSKAEKPPCKARFTKIKELPHAKVSNKKEPQTIHFLLSCTIENFHTKVIYSC
ncbi:MAG: hypothetical protein ACOYOA_16630, partial [Saprospiraceae bacterium]